MKSATQKPRFRRGIKSIIAFYNAHAAEPIDERQGYKMIARGTIPAGRDGRTLMAEEGAIIAALVREARRRSA